MTDTIIKDAQESHDRLSKLLEDLEERAAKHENLWKHYMQKNAKLELENSKLEELANARYVEIEALKKTASFAPTQKGNSSMADAELFKEFFKDLDIDRDGQRAKLTREAQEAQDRLDRFSKVMGMVFEPVEGSSLDDEPSEDDSPVLAGEFTEWVKHSDLTHQGIADKIGCSRQSVTNWTRAMMDEPLTGKFEDKIRQLVRG